jgi:hypothetical protein
MDDLLLALLEIFWEIVGEALFEFFFAGFTDLLLRAWGNFFRPFEIHNSFAASVGYALMGLVMGGMSLLFFSHHLVHPSKVHGISLVLGPACAGLLMWAMRTVLRRGNRKIIQFESFSYGYMFALGMALMRVFFAK